MGMCGEVTRGPRGPDHHVVPLSFATGLRMGDTKDYARRSPKESAYRDVSLTARNTAQT